MAKELYATFCQGEILLTDAVTAEMAKLVENAFRDVNIAFANELSVISDRLGVDVWELVRLANHHPRVNILQPGPGVGGHCIAVDPWFIVDADPEQAHLIRTARQVNDRKPEWVVNRVRDTISELERPVIAALGLAFKADIDDLRESPALEIVTQIAEEFGHARVLAVEPHISELPLRLAEHGNVELTPIDQALSAADVTLILVDHSRFSDFRDDIGNAVNIIDTRGFLTGQAG